MNKHIFTVVAVTALLSSCISNSPEMVRARSAQHQQQCEAMGMKTQEALLNCHIMLENQFQSNRRDMSNRLLAASAIMNSQTPAVRHTNCNRYGNQVNCTTW